MSRRKIVKLNLDFVNKRIKECFRHNVVFCEKMGRGPNWVTDWNRQPKPKNLPSPEEAAKMCALLQAQPEDILVEQDDIDLVRGLMEKEKEKQSAIQEVGGLLQLEPWEIEALTFFRSLSEGQRKVALAIAEETVKSLEKFAYLLPENEPEQK